jgi:hypothetical protein
MDEVSSQEIEKKEGARLYSIGNSCCMEETLTSENSPPVHHIDASDSRR